MKKRELKYLNPLIVLLIIAGTLLLIKYNRKPNVVEFLQEIRKRNKSGFDSLQTEINRQDVLYSLIQESINKGNFKTSFSLIDSLSAKGNVDMAHVYKGIVYEKQNNYLKAIEEYNNAIAMDEFSLGLSKRAGVYTKMNELDLALKDYKKIYEWNFDYSLEIAHAFELKEMKDSAMKYYMVYIEYYPNDELVSGKIDSLRKRISLSNNR